MTDAQKKLDWITEQVNAGRTVVIGTHYKAWEINKRTFDRFDKAGSQLFKTDTKSLYMARGKNWDCIDYCSIRAYS